MTPNTHLNPRLSPANRRVANAQDALAQSAPGRVHFIAGHLRELETAQAVAELERQVEDILTSGSHELGEATALVAFQQAHHLLSRLGTGSSTPSSPGDAAKAAWAEKHLDWQAMADAALEANKRKD